MQNIEVSVEGNIATIKLDTTKSFGLSKRSGKSIIIASSSGFQPISDGSNVKFSLNVIRPPTPEEKNGG